MMCSENPLQSEQTERTHHEKHDSSSSSAGGSDSVADHPADGAAHAETATVRPMHTEGGLRGEGRALPTEQDTVKDMSGSVESVKPKDASAICELSQPFGETLPTQTPKDDAAAELEADKRRMDLLESKVFTNREGEHEIHLDFTVGSLREACDMILSPSVIIKSHQRQ